MKKMLEYIGKKNKEFEQRKIFGWLKDTNIDHKQRLSFAPYMAHFVFSFMDVNRFILRDLERPAPVRRRHAYAIRPYSAAALRYRYRDRHFWVYLGVFGFDTDSTGSESLIDCG